MDRLPPLNPLRAFEAAGQLQSIRGAAERLSVTPGAVSRQVQVLESHLGVRLFRRFAREVMLTAEGEQYLEAVSLHLEGIRDATERLTGRRGIETLRVRAYTTIAMKWLIPRLSTFLDANPKIEVRLTTSNEAVDFSRENIDGAIRLGDGAWTGVEALCCTDQQPGAVSPPQRHLWEANVLRPPEFEHAVQRGDGNGHLGHLPPFGP